MAPLLILRDAIVGYRGAAGYFTAPAISFRLKRGEVLGLTGPNGIGKSTLLNVVLGRARLLGGTMEKPAGLRIGYLAQQPVRLAELPLSGHELLRCLAADGTPPPANLQRRLDSRIDRLSGGEYQLLCLWSRLAGSADLILLDEPTNHLDPEHIGLAAAQIATGRERRATLIVSHDRDFLATVCDRTIALAPTTAPPAPNRCPN